MHTRCYLFNCRYCKSMEVSEEIKGKKGKKKGLKVLFTSDKRKSGGGAQCTAQCVDPEPTTSGNIVFCMFRKKEKLCIIL